MRGVLKVLDVVQGQIVRLGAIWRRVGKMVFAGAVVERDSRVVDVADVLGNEKCYSSA